MKRIVFSFLALIGANYSFAQEKDSLLILADKLAPESQNIAASRLVVDALQSMHYKKVTINDSVSTHAFDRFLKGIDFTRSYFLASDIQKFESMRFLIDDSLRAGKNGFPYLVYNTYLRSMASRMAKIRLVLKDTFNFALIEEIEPDRENAAWFSTSKELDDFWRKRLKHEALSLVLSGKSGVEANETILKRYENYRKTILKTKTEDIYQSYINAITSCIDPHTDYMSPRAAEDFKINMSQSLEGIGATLTTEGDFTKIRELVKGGPADRSKLLGVGDKITAVAQGTEGDFVDVVGWRIDDVVQLIRGKKDTWVKLQIITSTAVASDPPKIVNILRDKVKLEEQTAKGKIDTVIQNKKSYKVGVITLPIFYSNFNGSRPGDQDYSSTTSDIKKILEGFNKSKVDAVLVDLRNNTGGSLTEAISLTGLFITSGPTVQIRQADGSVDVESDKDARIYYTGPLVVMVNRISASASEIFASAIQDYGRGVIVGEQTYGKGTVQNMLDMNRMMLTEKPIGQIKITRAKFYRINGESTQHRGVVPDIIFPSLFDAREFGESSEPFALEYDQIQPAKYNLYSKLEAPIQKLQKNHEERMKKNIDYKLLVDQIEFYKAERAKKSFTLNAEIAKIEKSEREKRDLARVNEKRVASGLPILSAEEEKPKEDKSDFVYEEGKAILIDLLKNNSKRLENSVIIGM